jgi:hypothetical protein
MQRRARVPILHKTVREKGFLADEFLTLCRNQSSVVSINECEMP